jgi:type I restriction enzyme, R subunit
MLYLGKCGTGNPPRRSTLVAASRWPEGHLVDYDLVALRSNIRMEGVFVREGEQVDRVDPDTGRRQLEMFEDSRHFEPGELERKVTAPDSNGKIVQELKKHAEVHETEHGRFPKTLIFAANDLRHTSHAQELVDLCRDVFGRGEAFVQKITGSPDVDRPLQRIREFRNRPQPGIVVTVDLLTTGVYIPDLEFLLFLRPVRSRILFEQMLGRGTRKGERYPDKSHFTVFDCFDGTLFGYFAGATGITADPPTTPSRTLREIVDDIWENRDREWNVGCLAKRLHRIDKQMSGEARERFAAFVPEGDLARFARGLEAALTSDFAGTMKTLRDPTFLDLCENYPRPERVFYRAIAAEDEVTSRPVLRDADGAECRPEDYLAAFSRFVRENPEKIEAIRILLDRPNGSDCGRILAEQGGRHRQPHPPPPKRKTPNRLKRPGILRLCEEGDSNPHGY